MSFPVEPPDKGQPQHPGISDQHLQQLIKLVISAELKIHRHEVEDYVDSKIEELAVTFKAAFPDGDALGHKRFHDQLIEAQKERKALVKDIRTRAVTGGLWLAAVLIATAIWEYVKREVRK